MPDDTRSEDAVDRYAHLRDEILGHLRDLVPVQAVRECPCEELREKLLSSSFNLVVLGQFKRGKTSLINALLGASILPVGVVPLTSIPTVLTYGEALRSKVYLNDGQVLEVRPENLAEYITEKGNPRNVKTVSHALVTYPSDYLKDGVRIIDTPGVGSVYQHNTDVAYQYLPKSDAALFLLSVDQPLSQAELDFLKEIRQYSNKIFFVLNKVDYFSESDISESVAFSGEVLSDAMGSAVTIYPVSAKLALEGMSQGSEEALHRSHLPAFAAVLNRFLVEEKGKALILSVLNNLLRVISHGRFEIDLELKSLTVPLEELRHKIALFEDKKSEVYHEKQDFDILLDGQVKGLIRDVLDADIEAAKARLDSELLPAIDRDYTEHRALPLKQLHDLLEQKLIDDLRAAYNAWRSAEDERLAKAFESITNSRMSPWGLRSSPPH